MNTIPVRHSLKAVLRYATFIDMVSANYPNIIVVDPSPLSPDTFACRFRDAVNGIMRYNSDPDRYDAVSQWFNDFAVAGVRGTKELYIGPRKAISAKQKAATPVGRVIDASISPIETINSPSDDILAAIVTLMNCHILEFATITGSSVEQVQKHLAAAEDRQIELMSEGNTITLL